MADERELAELGFICSDGGEEDGELELGLHRSGGGEPGDGGKLTPLEQTGSSEMSYYADFQDGLGEQTALAIPSSPIPNLPPIRVRCSTADSSSSDISIPSTAYPDELLGAFSDMLLSPTSPFNSYSRENYVPLVVGENNSTIYYEYGNGMNSFFWDHEQSQHSSNSASPSMMRNHINIGNVQSAIEPWAPGEGFASGSELTGWENAQDLNSTMDQIAPQMPRVDPLNVQYSMTADHAAEAAASFSVPSSSSYDDLRGAQTAYAETSLSLQIEYGVRYLDDARNSDNFYNQQPSFGPHNVYYEEPSFGQSVSSYQGTQLANPIVPASPVGPGSPISHGENNTSDSFGLREEVSMLYLHERYSHSLLEDLKENRITCHDLFAISGHIFEFSGDPFGSRFIQQKLETASDLEKEMVFQEIKPYAFKVMTDVFGNYVIQKFLEHANPEQRRKVARLFKRNVLKLSLHMHGCRIIQKAIEVLDMDLKVKMVKELRFRTLQCSHDQYGNHVMQKIIECIPQDAIPFIISTFYGKVWELSIDPCGCRVIQRLLEHCDNPMTRQIFMDEIIENVVLLAQHQYGNYVVQHVVQHGMPEEGSAVIKILARLMVQMSTQKYASNVIEKCFIFGGPADRQIFIEEMLGSSEKDEPLQAMMKDQYGNYVVQRVLDTCDDQQLELILSRMKLHLNTIRKDEFGKHIMARVRSLVAAGERRSRTSWI